MFEYLPLPHQAIFNLFPNLYADTEFYGYLQHKLGKSAEFHSISFCLFEFLRSSIDKIFIEEFLVSSLQMQPEMLILQ